MSHMCSEIEEWITTRGRQTQSYTTQIPAALMGHILQGGNNDLISELKVFKAF